MKIELRLSKSSVFEVRWGTSWIFFPAGYRATCLFFSRAFATQLLPPPNARPHPQNHGCVQKSNYWASHSKTNNRRSLGNRKTVVSGLLFFTPPTTVKSIGPRPRPWNPGEPEPRSTGPPKLQNIGCTQNLKYWLILGIDRSTFLLLINLLLAQVLHT